MKMKLTSIPMAAAIVLCVTQYAWGAPHVDLDIKLDPKTRMLSASALITAQSATLAFYLADGFVLEAAEVEGATVPTNRSTVDGLQRFQIDLHADASKQTVRLRYHGELQPLDAEQEQLVLMLRGEVEPAFPSAVAWRKFVADRRR
jgi:hypothetical protein